MRQLKTQARTQSQPNRLTIGFFSGILLTALAATLILLSSSARADLTELAPSPDYAPQQVVEIVVGALQSNSTEGNDEGIATVYRFASPGNRASTGPLERFARMVKGGFSDMLEHVDARYEPIEIREDKALQAVWLMDVTGKETGYAFQLGLQSSGKYEGMWMTEAVIPLGEGVQSGTRI